MFINSLRSFVRDECGQDLIEYTLLLGFIVMTSAALLIGGGQDINTIWQITQNNLSSAHSAAAGS